MTAVSAYALSPGDIAIIGVHGDDVDGTAGNGNTEGIAWVPLVNLAGGTEIFFTDSGWTAAGAFRGSEGAIKYTVPAGGIVAGTVLLLEFDRDTAGNYTFSAASTGYTDADDAIVGTTGLLPAGPGDNLFIFEGSTAAPTFIWSWKNDGPYDSDSTSNSTTALPATLTLGINAMTIETTEDGTDNSRHTGPTSGTPAQLAAAIANPANWEKAENFPFPGGGNDITNGTLGSGFTVAGPPTPTPTNTATPIPPTPTPTETPVPPTPTETPVPPTPTPTETPVPPTPTPTETPVPPTPTPTETLVPPTPTPTETLVPPTPTPTNTPVPPTPTPTDTPVPPTSTETPVPPTPTPTNQVPSATNDDYSTMEDTPLTVAAPGVLGNDSDPDNDPLTAVLVNNVTNGTLMLNADGSFTYTPNVDFVGTDSFTYVASDGTGQSAPTTVTILVNAVIVDANGFFNLTNVSTMLDQTAQPNAPSGVYTITAVFQNKNDSPAVENLFFEVVTLTNGNLLLNADGGPGGVGAQLSIPATDLGPDGVLSPGESFTVAFVIGLQQLSAFDFFVNAFGQIDGVAGSGTVTLFRGEFKETPKGQDEPDTQMQTLFLPVISNTGQ